MNVSMKFLKHQLHTLQKTSLLACGNQQNSPRRTALSFSNGTSWKQYSSCSRSHIITGWNGENIQQALLLTTTHARSLSNVWRNSGTDIARRGVCTNSFKTRAGEFYSFAKVKTGCRESHKNFTGKRCFATMTGKGPGLIVFDLDCTLWPHHVDTTVNPPFIQKNSKVVDQDGVNITYYPEVPQVLQYLQSEGYQLAAASRTTKPPAAEQLLEFFDWNKYFKYKEIYPGSKVTHFAKFVQRTSIPHHEMLFFDDEQRNITDMEKEGVKCVFVRDGVNLQLVKDSIEKFKSGLM